MKEHNCTWERRAMILVHAYTCKATKRDIGVAQDEECTYFFDVKRYYDINKAKFQSNTRGIQIGDTVYVDSEDCHLTLDNRKFKELANQTWKLD